MKPSLCLDEDTMATALVVALRARGADVQTVVEAGLRAKDDKAQLEWAETKTRERYTHSTRQISAGCIESISTTAENTLALSWFHANATMLSNKSGCF